MAGPRTAKALTIHPLERLTGTAVRGVRTAGEILLDSYHKGRHVVDAFPFDLKLRIDRLCEESILGIILDAFPDHGIITEEGGVREGSSGYVWIVDPLDGTVNYYYGIPYFASSMACYYREDLRENTEEERARDLTSLGAPLVGAVFWPVAGELFLGVAGQGATCNGRAIHVRGETELGEAIIGISYGSDEHTMRRMERLSSRIIRRVRKVRIFGATSLDLAQVACGRISGLVQGCVRNWDIAAGRIILEESGGILDAGRNGENAWEIVACCPGIHDPLMRLFRPA